MPTLNSWLMILAVTVVAAGTTFFIQKQIYSLPTIDGNALVTIPSMSTPDATSTPDGSKPDSTPKPTPVTPNSNIAQTITGTLTAVNTGCFSDGVCFAIVDGKKVVLLIGRYQGPLGKIIGAESIGDLEGRIGESVTVYATKDTDGNFTLLGSDKYYLKLTSTTAPVAGACKVGGCSSQLCGEASDMDGMVTTCEFRAEYACYQKAKCERQTTGKCGWTEDASLTQCLKNPPTQM